MPPFILSNATSVAVSPVTGTPVTQFTGLGVVGVIAPWKQVELGLIPFPLKFNRISLPLDVPFSVIPFIVSLALIKVAPFGNCGIVNVPIKLVPGQIIPSFVPGVVNATIMVSVKVVLTQFAVNPEPGGIVPPVHIEYEVTTGDTGTGLIFIC